MTTTDVDAALARAVVYRTLAVAFQPPSEAALQRIEARDGFPTLAAALHGLGGGLARLAPSLDSLAVSDAGSLAFDYWRLFGHTTRGLVCACETEYGPDNGFHQPQQLADIAGYYLAFGLRPATDGEVRPDHIACECEFMDFLCRKQARGLAARSRDLDETLETTAAAERTFFRDHVGRFGRAFGVRMASEDPTGFYGVIGRVLLALVDTECARLGVTGGPIDLLVRPEEVDDVPMACGDAAGGPVQALPVYRGDPSSGERLL
jgi:putative dimethyl sulfoxide reductase chaperone